MKTKYSILFCLALSVAACSEDDVILSSGSDEIKLGVTTDMVSRAVQIYNSTFFADSFYVNAYTQEMKIANDGTKSYVPYIYCAPVKDVNNRYYNKDRTTMVEPTFEYHDIQGHVPDWQFVNRIDNTPVPDAPDNPNDPYTYTAWEVGPKYLWPDEPLDFYALRWEPDELLENSIVTAPDDDDCPFKGEKALMVKDFAIDGYLPKITQWQEVLYAVTLGQTKKMHEDGSAVPLYFRHALSALKFKFVNKSECFYVDVRDIKLCGVKHKGDLYIQSADTQNAKSEDRTTCYWSVDEESFKDIELYEDVFTLQSGDVADRTDVPNTILTIPQPHDAGTGTSASSWSGVYLKISCLIKYNNNGGAIFSSATDSSTPADLYVPIPEGTWLPGYVYYYTLTFGRSGNSAKDGTGDEVFVPIEIEASTTDWNTGQVFELDVADYDD